MKYKLRPHQASVISEIMHNEQTIQLTTGAGKTTTFFSFAFDYQPNSTFLFLAPQINLAKQTAEQRHLEVGYLQGSNRRGLHKRVVIGTIQTTLNRVKKSRFDISSYDYIFIDEAHKEEKKIEEIKKYLKPHQKIVYMTATPIDGQGFYKPYLSKNIIGSEFDYYYMIEQGYLTNIIIYQIGDLDTSNIRLNKDNEFNDKELMSAIKNSDIDIVKTSLEKIDRTRPTPTLVMAQNIAHAEELCKSYIEAGVKARVLHSKLPENVKPRLLNALKKGEIEMIVSVKMLTTGIDIPSIGNLVIATKIGSVVEYLQYIGRGIRASKGKTHCNIIDIFGTTEQHGHPFEVEFKPFSEKKSSKKRKKSNCPECKKGSLKVTHISENEDDVIRHKTCNNCGFEDVEIEAKDIISCTGCGYKGTKYNLFQDEYTLYKSCMCGNLVEEVGKIIPRKLIIALGDLKQAKKTVIDINNDRLNASELSRFLLFANKEHVAYLLDVLGFAGRAYRGLEKVEKRVREFNSRYNELHMELLRLYDYDSVKFHKKLEEGKSIYELIATAKRAKQTKEYYKRKKREQYLRS